MVRIHFLGTNGWYDTDTGSTICIAIEHPRFSIVLDAGNGIHKLGALADKDLPVYIFLSHLHLDHVCGLHVLNKFSFSKPVNIFVPDGQQKYIELLLKPPFSLGPERLSFPVHFHELPADIGALPFEAEVFAMNHTVPTLAIRMQLEGKTIAYCPDTGLCENAVQAAKDADLLIAESAYLPGQNYPHWPHLNPESAATLAVRANARKLFLVHFDASRYLSMEDRQNGLKAARKIFDKTELGRDGLVLETGD